MFYKDTNNKPFYDPSAQVIEKFNLTEITEQEFDEIVTEINTPTPEQLIKQAVAEAHTYLNSTDYVVIKLNEAQVLGEDITAMKAEYADVLAAREVKRQLIRDNPIEE